MARGIEQRLPPGTTVETPAQRKADLHRVMRSLATLLRGIALIGLVAAFLITFNRLSTAFEARAWQIGVLRAIGVRQRRVLWELLTESVVLGGLGMVIGIPLGIGLGWLMLPAVTTSAAIHYKMQALAVGLAVDGSSLLLAAGLALGATVSAAVAPAWRATRVSVADTIRARGREQSVATVGWRAVVWGVGAAATVGAVVLQAATQQAAWGLVSSVLIAMLTALAARPFLTGLMPALTALVSPHAGPTVRFAAARAAHDPRRAGLTVAMLAVGLGAVFWVGLIAYSFRHSVADAMPGVLRGDLVVSSTHIASGLMEAPVSGELVTELRALGGSPVDIQPSPFPRGPGRCRRSPGGRVAVCRRSDSDQCLRPAVLSRGRLWRLALDRVPPPRRRGGRGRRQGCPGNLHGDLRNRVCLDFGGQQDVLFSCCPTCAGWTLLLRQTPRRSELRPQRTSAGACAA